MTELQKLRIHSALRAVVVFVLAKAAVAGIEEETRSSGLAKAHCASSLVEERVATEGVMVWEESKSDSEYSIEKLDVWVEIVTSHLNFALDAR